MTKSVAIKLGRLGIELVLIIVVLALAATTVAWFSQNKEVTATGMTVQVQATESLIIGGTPSEVGSSSSDASNSYIFTHGPMELLPSTHDNSFATKLKTVTNTEDVDNATGLVGDTALQYAVATEGECFVDFTFYIGTIGKDYEYTSMTVSTVPERTFAKYANDDISTEAGTYYTRNSGTGEFQPVELAAGVNLSGYYYVAPGGGFLSRAADVYLGDPDNGGTYKGTIKYNAQNGTFSTVQIYSTSGTITLGTSVEVTIRCYFDGALLDTDGKAILRSGTVKLETVMLAFDIDAPTN